jgi:hypothetical protein
MSTNTVVYRSHVAPRNRLGVLDGVIHSVQFTGKVVLKTESASPSLSDHKA